MAINNEMVVGESPEILASKVLVAITAGKQPTNSPFSFPGPHGPLFYQEVAESTGNSITDYTLIQGESVSLLASKLDTAEGDGFASYGEVFAVNGPHGRKYFQGMYKGTVAEGGGGGAPGADGKTVLNGTAAPAATVGTSGDFYIDTSAWDIYGPKDTAWGTGTSLVGPAGTGGGVSLTTTNVWTKNNSVTFVALTDGATISTDASLSNNFFVELNNATALLQNPTNLTDGMVINWVIKQGAGGTKLMTFGNKFKFLGGVSTLSTTAGNYDMLSGIYHASNDVIICNLAIGAA